MHMAPYKPFAFCVLLFITQVHGFSNELTITVFYETLCPFSRVFIQRSLLPAYQKFWKYIALEMVPYGNAWHSVDPWRMICQHGESECYGNTVQACFINEIKNEAIALSFIRCFVSAANKNNVRQLGYQCAARLNQNYKEIEKCVQGPKGRTLMNILGERTHTFQPKILRVPTVVFNNKYNKTIQDQRNHRLEEFICNHLNFRAQECLQWN